MELQQRCQFQCVVIILNILTLLVSSKSKNGISNNSLVVFFD